MALDATVAGASADSYLSVADADTLAGTDMGPEADKWLDAKTTTLSREKALKRATREIDGYIRSGWDKYSADQALRFPREIDEASSSPFIPADIEVATYHQAAYVLKNAPVIDKANARHARGMSQFSESNLSGSVDEDVVNIISPRAMHYLSGFSVTSGGKRSGLGSVRLSSGFSA